MSPEVLAARLTAIDAKLDAIHRETRDDLAALTSQITAHNGRLTKAETRLIEMRVRDEERQRQIEQNRNIKNPVITSVVSALIVMAVTYVVFGGPVG